MFRQDFLQIRVHFFQDLLKLGSIFCPIRKVFHILSVLKEPIHNFLKCKICVWLSHSSEILRVFVHESVEQDGGNFIHALAICHIGLLFQIDKQYSGYCISVG